ncbi:MAG TPA: hypothetical protein VMF89_20105, partial [Polyangiales bacterium]|nr:hypothetical protein [Polyangiales bacterium]
MTERPGRVIPDAVPPPTGPLDAELDVLFQQPPAAHVEARDALATSLRKAGDRAAAERVKKLKRPSPPAWAINQLHFHKAELLEAAQRATAALATLHARDGVGPGELSAAVATQRRAIQAALDAAVRDAAEAGLPISSVDQRKIETTLKAWLAGAGDESPGRMTHELEASGFAAVTAVGFTSSRPPAKSEHVHVQEPPGVPLTAAPAQATLPLVAATPKQTGPDPARLSRVRANVRKREQEAEAARKLADQVETELEQQTGALERTRSELREAERALQALSSQLRQQESALRTHRSHSTE